MHANSVRSIQSPCRAAFRRVSVTSHAARQLSSFVFPHGDTVFLEQQKKEVTAASLVEVLQGSVSPERLEKMQKVPPGIFIV